MPVRRLRTLEEAEQAVWMASDDPLLWPTIVEVWESAERMSPRRYPPGVRKFRSIEALNAAREAADAALVRAR